MIKAIIFDADGVVNHGRRPSLALEQDYGVALDKILPFFEGPFQPCLTGEADLKEVVVPFLPSIGWQGGADSFLDYWFRVHDDIDEVALEYIQELRGKKILCVLGTNQEKHRFKYMLDKMGLGKFFDKMYASAHLGSKKPDPEFFAKILKDLGNIDKKEILFVDDKSKNVKSAQEFGLHAHLFTDLENLKQKLEEIS